MKGVIAGICPDARVIDITHQVEPFQIAQAAYLLSQSWKWFPPGTIHVAVVDPGVGSDRRPFLVEAGKHLFILPDNGLLTPLVPHIAAVREIRNEALFLKPVSRTFHGRDIFSAAAANLACGFPLAVDEWVSLPPSPNSVLHVDRFGNVITSLRPASTGALRIRDSLITTFAPTYSAAPAGELFLIEGSGGYLEISLREASAAARIGCRVGDPLTLEAVPDDKS